MYIYIQGYPFNSGRAFENEYLAWPFSDNRLDICPQSPRKTTQKPCAYGWCIQNPISSLEQGLTKYLLGQFICSRARALSQVDNPV